MVNNKKHSIVEFPEGNYSAAPKGYFFHVWKETYGTDSLKANPWVGVVRFEPIEANVDRVLKEHL